jgi:AraC family transcriptional regulator
MQPRVVELAERKLVGIKIRTSLSENRTRELWQQFKPAARNIRGRASTDFYSVQFFDEGTTFETITPRTLFDKWAAVEVSDFENIPPAMLPLLLSGKYAVFIHTGLPSRFPETAEFIYRGWLPKSGYEVDARAHFEIMSSDYRPDDPNAHEEVWVPIRSGTGANR